MIDLMYITNDPIVAKIADKAGVNRIFVDLEFIGKAKRQYGMDTVQSHHTIEDVKHIADVVENSELLVRINPVHENYCGYIDTEEEIEGTIKNGAQILMLPYFKTKAEVARFIKVVNKRVKTILLLETSQAVENLDSILEVDGIDEIHIGLNDLSLCYKKKFMFEILADGTVDEIIKRIKSHNIKYGFGGIAAIHSGLVPCEYILGEHYRLGSSMAILSRSFCDVSKCDNYKVIKQIFSQGIQDIRNYEEILKNKPNSFFIANRSKFVNCVNNYMRTIK